MTSAGAQIGHRSTTEFARAKVNLTLEVAGRRGDGYHELASLVAFADVGDELIFSEGPGWTFACSGPKARAITGENLVERAAQMVRARWPAAATGHAQLIKRLPVAAGIGGGSADAAAVLRALKQRNPELAAAPEWLTIAQMLGADVPVCLANTLSYICGVGDNLNPIKLDLCLPAVLVNPGTPLLTARVFADLAAPPLKPDFAQSVSPKFGSPADLLEWIIAGRNDLEAPALRLAPEVGRVRAALLAADGCQLARMSGSGPTCFGIFGSTLEAQATADLLARQHSDWWVRATHLS